LVGLPQALLSSSDNHYNRPWDSASFELTFLREFHPIHPQLAILVYSRPQRARAQAEETGQAQPFAQDWAAERPGLLQSFEEPFQAIANAGLVELQLFRARALSARPASRPISEPAEVLPPVSRDLQKRCTGLEEHRRRRASLKNGHRVRDVKGLGWQAPAS
jgi:hypothetical protein